MSTTQMDQATFERLLGTKVSPSQFAALSVAGAPLYIALHQIMQEANNSQESCLSLINIKAIASSAFVQALG